MILTFSLAATVGCGASSSEPSGVTADAGVDATVAYPATCESDANTSSGLLVPSDFSRMIWRGEWTWQDYDGPCSKQVDTRFVLDAVASSLTWTGRPIWGTAAKDCLERDGQLTLTRPQVEALWQSSPTKVVGGPAGCQGDVLSTLEVDRCGEITRYVDSLEGCRASPDLLVAEGVANVYTQIEKLLPQEPGTMPVFVAPEGFVSFTVHRSGGMPARRIDECDTSYQNTYSVDAASRIFTWDYCKWDGNSGAAPSTGSRTLDDGELTRLARALSILKLHDGEDCGFDKPTITLDLQTRSGVATYTDSFYACRALPGATYVDNIDDLMAAIGELLE